MQTTQRNKPNTSNATGRLHKFETAGTFAYGHNKRLVTKQEISLFEINPSIEMHILRHFKEASETYRESLIGKSYYYFDHSVKKFKRGEVNQKAISNALNTKGTKFAKFVRGIENPRKLLTWLKRKATKLLDNKQLYLITKDLDSKIFLQLEYPAVVGEIDVVNMEELTNAEKSRVKKIARSDGHDKATEMNVIEGNKKIPTKSIAFLLHKVPELDFFFGSAFPGYLDPDFGNDKEADKKYWENLVFIQ